MGGAGKEGGCGGRGRLWTRGAVPFTKAPAIVRGEAA
jgi:hypothetical protein